MASIRQSGGFPIQFGISESLRLKMLAHVIACLPDEACGLVGSEQVDILEIKAKAVLPVENELHSQVRYRMAPAEQLKAFYWLEEHHLEMAALFHSHPQGPDHPSATDLAEFAYPGVLMLILSPISLSLPLNSAQNWQTRAYQIVGGQAPYFTAREIPVVVTQEPQPG